MNIIKIVSVCIYTQTLKEESKRTQKELTSTIVRSLRKLYDGDDAVKENKERRGRPLYKQPTPDYWKLLSSTAYV